MTVQQPNIIFILADQLRHDMLGCYGHHSVITPNLDQLATDGVLFENYYASNPICMPARVSMITGKYVHDHHCHLNQHLMGRDEVCFPALLRDNGYNTAMIGKLHLWEQWDRPGKADHGFQYTSIVEGKHSLHSRVEECGMYYDYLNEHDLPLPFNYDSSEQINEMLWARVSEYSPEDHIDGVITRRAVRFIDQHHHKPFMMQVGLCSPHEFYDPPQKFYDMYEGVDIPDPVFSPESMATKSAFFNKFVTQKLEAFGLSQECWDEATIERVKEMRRHYLATVTFVDDLVGKIIQSLKDNGIYENSVIVFAADHGEYQGDHGMMIKGGMLYEPNVHIPLIISAPGRTRNGARIKDFAQNTDLFATFLDYAGVKKPEDSYSMSLRPLVECENATGRKCVFAEMNDRRMVRKGQYKLLYYREENFLELYDIEEDPLEQHNLFHSDNPARTEYSAIVQDLLLELVNFFIDTEPVERSTAINRPISPWMKSSEAKND